MLCGLWCRFKHGSEYRLDQLASESLEHIQPVKYAGCLTWWFMLSSTRNTSPTQTSSVSDRASAIAGKRTNYLRRREETANLPRKADGDPPFQLHKSPTSISPNNERQGPRQRSFRYKAIRKPVCIGTTCTPAKPHNCQTNGSPTITYQICETLRSTAIRPIDPTAD